MPSQYFFGTVLSIIDMRAMDINTKIFFKINNLIGRSKFLDHFGRAGAEWLIVAMGAWYTGAVLIDRMPEISQVFWALAFLAIGWSVGWLINLGIAYSVHESRPYISYPQIKSLFKPLMSWKSFPSDHAMSAFLILFLSYIFNLPGSWALVPMALWVSWGRVYAGAHYPLDILGGLSVALFVSLLIKALVSYLYL